VHIVHLAAPAIGGDDPTKDIDFGERAVHQRWSAGRDDTRRMIERAPWQRPTGPIDGVIVYRLEDL